MDFPVEEYLSEGVDPSETIAVPRAVGVLRIDDEDQLTAALAKCENVRSITIEADIATLPSWLRRLRRLRELSITSYDLTSLPAGSPSSKTCDTSRSIDAPTSRRSPTTSGRSRGSRACGSFTPRSRSSTASRTRLRFESSSATATSRAAAPGDRETDQAREGRHCGQGLARARSTSNESQRHASRATRRRTPRSSRLAARLRLPRDQSHRADVRRRRHPGRPPEGEARRNDLATLPLPAHRHDRRLRRKGRLRSLPLRGQRGVKK